MLIKGHLAFRQPDEVEQQVGVGPLAVAGPLMAVRQRERRVDGQAACVVAADVLIRLHDQGAQRVVVPVQMPALDVHGDRALLRQALGQRAAEVADDTRVGVL